MEKLSIYLQIIISTMHLQMKQSFARPMFRFCLICNPIVNTIFLYEMFLNKGMDAFLNHVVVGAGLMGIWGCICFSSVGDINRERWSCTLPIIYVAPGGFGLIIFGKVLGNTVMSLLTFVLSYVTAGMIFKSFSTYLGGKTASYECGSGGYDSIYGVCRNSVGRATGIGDIYNWIVQLDG